MCLEVTKKYPPNSDIRVAYKVFRSVYNEKDANYRYFSVYRGMELIERELIADTLPDFREGRLFGGSIHCFTTLEEARRFIKYRERCSFDFDWTYAIFGVSGTGVIAEGTFSVIDDNAPFDSIAFRQIKILKEIK